MINEDVRKTFRIRAAVTNFIRRYLQECGSIARDCFYLIIGGGVVTRCRVDCEVSLAPVPAVPLTLPVLTERSSTRPDPALDTKRNDLKDKGFLEVETPMMRLGCGTS